MEIVTPFITYAHTTYVRKYQRIIRSSKSKDRQYNLTKWKIAKEQISELQNTTPKID
jgi:hypothetical protein